MLVDTFENLPYYFSLFPHLQTILEFLKQNPLNRLPIGRHNILKDDVYVNIDTYNTQPNKPIEAHRTYIDLQILIEGTEQIGWCPISKAQPTCEYNAEKDIIFLKGTTEKLVANPHLFFIFLPHDAHQPCLHNGSEHCVKKAVFKIKI